METQPLLRVSLAVLTIGSLLAIAVVNLVGSGGRKGGPGRKGCACFPGGGSQSLMLGTYRF